MDNNVIPIENAIMKKQGRPSNNVIPKGELIKEARKHYEPNREKFAKGLKRPMSPVTVARIENSARASADKIKQVIEPLNLKYEDVIEVNTGSPDADVRDIVSKKFWPHRKIFKGSALNSLDFHELCIQMRSYLEFEEWQLPKDAYETLGVPASLISARSYITEQEKTPEIDSAFVGLEGALNAMLRDPKSNSRSGQGILEAYRSEPPLEEHIQVLDTLGVAVVGATYDYWTSLDTADEQIKWIPSNQEIFDHPSDSRIYHRWKRLAIVVDRKTRINNSVYMSVDTGRDIDTDALSRETEKYGALCGFPPTPSYWPHKFLQTDSSEDMFVFITEGFPF